MNYQSLSNEQLVEALKSGNHRAFEEIYDRFAEKLFALAYAQVGNKEEAEDIIHDLFEDLWKKQAESSIRNLATYLVVSVKYLTVAYIKSQMSLRKFQEYLIFNEIQQFNAVEDIVNFGDLQRAVDNAMKTLPEKTVEVFKMSRFERKSVRDIADNLQLSEKAVEYHITKSLRVLREHLHQHTQVG